MLKVGDKAPAFCAFNQDDTEICLRDIVGNWISFILLSKRYDTRMYYTSL